jgi:hypothetical protein
MPLKSEIVFFEVIAVGRLVIEAVLAFSTAGIGENDMISRTCVIGI